MAVPGTRVLIASRLFTPEVGAAAFRLQALADGLVAAGASVRVVTTVPPTGAPAPGRTPGLTVSRFPVLRDAGGNVRGYVQYLSFDIPLFFRLLFVRADVVVSEPPPTTGLVVAVTSWLRRRPYVYYAADIWTEALAATSAPGLVTRLMHRVEGYVLRRAAHVLAISDGVAEKVRRFGADPTRVTTVGNGVDTSIFTVDGPTAEGAPARLRARIAEADDDRTQTQGAPSATGAAAAGATPPYFVYTGTMSEWQGAGVFIEALAAVRETNPDARLYFFGQGSAEGQLRALAAARVPGAVVFGGVIPPAETATWLRSAAAALVSIVPGQGYDFAKPTKIYAAAACGAPVIFAGTGASTEMVQHAELGWTPEYTAAAVAEAMLEAIAAHPSPTASATARAGWVAENASLSAAGTRAAAAVLDVAP